jgi:NADPH:quinone reductase-like Zn-dependent oxidoreductase
MLIHKPGEISWEVAAGIPETWITAIQAMYFVASFAPGKSILWHAGASSVSIAGIQLSKAHGASAIYTTVGSSSKVEFCKVSGGNVGLELQRGELVREVIGGHWRERGGHHH